MSYAPLFSFIAIGVMLVVSSASPAFFVRASWWLGWIILSLSLGALVFHRLWLALEHPMTRKERREARDRARKAVKRGGR